MSDLLAPPETRLDVAAIRRRVEQRIALAPRLRRPYRVAPVRDAARLREILPFGPSAPGQGLAIGVTSYDAQVGLTEAMG